MRKAQMNAGTAFLMAVAMAVLAGCSKPPAVPAVQGSPVITAPSPTDTAPVKPPAPPVAEADSKPAPRGDRPAVEVVTKPEEITVLVNKRFSLPADYRPGDLVDPNVPFVFKERDEKRMMRKEAAHALELLFAGAKKDGIHLAGVSGYRSYDTQKWLFDYYVRTQGEEVARKYSAEPGHSEHQTGLAMDVSGSTGECAADDCFAGTPEAQWLAGHAAEFGFIIRYPKGKETVTGYNYEPWHLRYVGTAMSKQIAAKGLTLEEHLGQSR